MLLCKHDECEHKKRLNFCTQYKISTTLCDFIPKCRSWRIVDTLKDKKRKKDQNKNNKRKKKTTTTKKKKKNIAKLGFEPRSLAWKASVVATGVLYHMDVVKRSMRYLCEFLYLVWETSIDKILRFLANSNFLNQQKRRGSLSVRIMNLGSHETSVSIVTQAICTGIF